MFRRGLPLLIGGLLAACSLCSAAFAQQFPARGITIIVSSAVGGITDIAARIFGRALSETTGRPVVVENRVGGGGVAGMNAIMSAPPDGYTIGLVNRPIVVFRPTMSPDFRITPGKDYTPLALLIQAPLVFVTHPNAPFNTITELVAQAKAKPGSILYGSPGVATAGHLSVELLQLITGTKLTHVPYTGENAAIADLVTGRVHLFAAGSGITELVAAGKLKAIAVIGTERWKLFPKTPTVAESGIPGYGFESFVGIVGPPGISKDVQEALTKAIAASIAPSDVVAKLEQQGLVVTPKIGDEFLKYLQEDLVAWKKVVDASGLKMD